MNNRSWKAALWDVSWEDLSEGKYNRVGLCQFAKNEGALLEIPFGDISRTRVLETTGVYKDSIEPKKYDYLYGFTQDGVRLVLCNVFSKGIGESIPGSTCETFGASTVLSSRSEFDPSAPMLSAEFEIELLSDWINCRYKPAYSENAYTIDYKDGSLSLPLHLSSEACIEIRVGINSLQNTASGLSVPYYCYVRIEYPYGKTVDDIWQTDLWKLQSLFAFCFGAYPEITSARVRQSRGNRWIHVYRSSANTGRHTRLSSRPPISFHRLGRNGLLELAENWFALSGDERHAADMLTSLLGSWNMPLDLELLAATTMFESLVRANRPPLYSKEELGKLSKPVVEVADEKIRNRVRGILGLLKEPSYYQKLNMAYEESEPWSERLLPRWSKFRDEQYVLRNSGAHGAKSDKNSHLRIDHYHAQIVLAYIILMKRLGMSSEAIDQFEQSSFLNVARYEIATRYAKS